MKKLQRTWKPDRDWNDDLQPGPDADLGRCNELENPIGIETRPTSESAIIGIISCNELENPIGIETTHL